MSRSHTMVNLADVEDAALSNGPETEVRHASLFGVESIPCNTCLPSIAEAARAFEAGPEGLDPVDDSWVE